MSDVKPPAKLGDHRVLIINDDGIEAHGIKLLEEIAREFTDDVWVVAPDEEKSGFSHSISMTIPIRVRKVDDRHFAVKGTLTDCALLAIYEFMGGRPPTCCSPEVNRGANLAEDITYSGTAAAAMEGALLGIRSIALSQVFEIGRQVHWSTARHFAPPILERLLACDWEPWSFVDVNFPDAAPEKVGRTRVTTQGRRLPGSFRPVRRVDGRDFPYYWIKLTYKTGGSSKRELTCRLSTRTRYRSHRCTSTSRRRRFAKRLIAHSRGHDGLGQQVDKAAPVEPLTRSARSRKTSNEP